MSINQKKDADRDIFLKLSASLPVSEALWRFFEFKEISLVTPQMEAPILDLGCGNGQFSYALFNKITAGIDLSHRCLLAAKKLDIYDILLLADARELPFPNDSFKTVLCNCTLEHISNPEKCITEVNRVLKRGGKFIITVPSEFFDDLLLIRCRGYAEKKNEVLAHINMYTLETWRNLLAASGFEVTESRLYLPPFFMKVWDFLDAGYHLPVAIMSFPWDFALRRRFILSLLYNKLLKNSRRQHVTEKTKPVGGARLIIAEKR